MTMLKRRRLRMTAVLLGAACLSLSATPNFAADVADSFNREDSDTLGKTPVGGCRWVETGEKGPRAIRIWGKFLILDYVYGPSPYIFANLEGYKAADVDIRVKGFCWYGSKPRGLGISYRLPLLDKGLPEADGYHVLLNATSVRLRYARKVIAEKAGDFPTKKWHAIRVIAQGTRHKVYVDDILQIDVEDATNRDAGFVGLTQFYEQARFDDFQVTTLSQSPMPAAKGTHVLPPSAWLPLSGNWEVDGDWLKEFSDASNAGSLPFWALAGPRNLGNYRLEADVRAFDGVGAIYMALRWKDKDNHYALEYRDPGQELTIVHVRNGKSFPLVSAKKTAKIGYLHEEPVRLAFQAHGPILSAFVGKQRVLEVTHSAFSEGRVALGERDRRAGFKNIRLVELEAPQDLPAVAKVEYVHPRKVFLRQEKGVACGVAISNIGRKALVQASVRVSLNGLIAKEFPLPDLDPGKRHVIQYPIDTVRLKAGRYSLDCQVLARGRPLLSDAASVWIAPRINPYRFDVLMWDTLGGKEHALKRMHEIGFTSHLIANVSSTALEKDESAGVVSEGARGVADNGLKYGLESYMRVYTVGPFKTHPETKPVNSEGKPMITRRGQVSRYSCPNHPWVREMSLRFADRLGETMKPYPGLRYINVNTETETHEVCMEPCRHDFCLRRIRDELGFELPADVQGVCPVEGHFLRRSRNPAQFGVSPEGLIDDDNRYYRFLQWWWTTGSGFPEINRLFSDRIKKALPNVTTFHDQSLAGIVFMGRCSGLDMLSNWTYTNPSPLNVAVVSDALLGAADERQAVCQMIQLFWYSSDSLESKGALAAKAEVPRVRRDVDLSGSFISIAPAHLREATWLALSRPISKLQYFGAPAISDKAGAFVCTNSHLVHELERLSRELIRPYGPVLRMLKKRPSKVAILKSTSSHLFAPAVRAYGVGDLHRVLLLAQVHPDVLYDETILKRGLDAYRVLVIPHGRVLLKGVDARIRKFVANGGIVMADEYLTPKYENVVRFDPPKVSRLEGAAYQEGLVQHAAKFKALLEEKGYVYPVKSSSPDVVLTVRERGPAKYIFVINDRRRAGEYVGLYGVVLDEGVPQRAELMLDEKAFGKGVLYDVQTGQELPVNSRDGSRHTAVNLPPAGGKLLYWSPRRIDGVKVSVPETAQKGGTVVIRLRVIGLDDKTLPGLHPVQLTIRDGTGRLNEYSGYYPAVDGQLSLEVPLAINDFGGYWQITAKELITGRVAEGSFLLQ